MCTIAGAKVQLNYNCYNVYFNGCLLLNSTKQNSQKFFAKFSIFGAASAIKLVCLAES